MKVDVSRRALQIVLGLLSLVPLMNSFLGVVLGAARTLPAENVTAEFDSQYRYLSGFYIALFLIAWWSIPAIERRAAPIRIVSAAIFLGGVGRVLAWIQVGPPPWQAMVFTAFELAFPLFAVWQESIRRRYVGESADSQPALAGSRHEMPDG